MEPWSIGRAFSRTSATLGLSGGLLVLLIAGCGWLFWTRGRDRRFVGSPVDQTMGNATGDAQAVPLFERGIAPVEFAPPEDLRPGQVGTIIDEQANTLDVTATIVDLAVRGYLTIEEIPKEGWFGKPDWTLHRTDKADADLLTYESTLLSGLFKDGNDPTLSSLRRTFSERLTKVEDQLYADAVKRGWFVKRPDKVRASWHARGALLFVAGLVLTFVLARWTTFGLVGIPVIVAGVILTVGARWMPSRTAKGTAIARRVGGFRTVIETAETHMSRWAEEQNVFTRYLPVRHRVRPDGEVGEGVRGTGTDAARHDVVPVQPAVHLRGLRQGARRLLGHDRRHDRVDAGVLRLERLLRWRLLGRRRRWRRRRVVVTRSMGRRAHRLL